MARRNRQKRAAYMDRSIGLLLILVGILLISLLIGGAWWIRRSTPTIDAETNCPVTGPKVVHVLMFDRSDPISGQQAQRIKFGVNELKRAADFGYRFDIYTFEGDSKSALEPIMTICSPGKPEDANELIQNPEFLRRRYEERFSGVLDKTVDGLLQVSSRDNSPIIESLRAAALTSFGPINEGQTKLRLTLISDMVQHSAQYSQFRSDQTFQQLSRTPMWATLRPNLKQAEVNILYLLRPSAKRGNASIQSRGHQLFWEQLIQNGNGIAAKIEPI
jgi:hypothetical protein